MGDNMNKVLVIVYVPFIEQKYEVYIPINKRIGTIKKILINSISEFTDGNFAINQNIKIYDRESGNILRNYMYVKETNIRNGSELVLM